MGQLRLGKVFRTGGNFVALPVARLRQGPGETSESAGLHGGEAVDAHPKRKDADRDGQRLSGARLASQPPKNAAGSPPRARPPTEM